MGRRSAVLLLGLGAPARPEEIPAFLARIPAGLAFAELSPAEAEERLCADPDAGRSDLAVQRLAEKLSLELERGGDTLPVRAGFLACEPFIGDVIRELSEERVERLAALVLAPQQSALTWDRYVDAVTEAVDDLGDDAPEVELGERFHDDPRLAEALAERVEAAAERLSGTVQAPIVFAARSLPERIAADCRYAAEAQETARLVSVRLGLESWRLAYQRAGGDAHAPWLGPSLDKVLGELRQDGAKAVVLASIGCVFDELDVLCDLDVRATATAARLGLELARAASVGDHPAFMRLLADRARDALAG